MVKVSKFKKNKELLKKVCNITSHLGSFAIVSAFAYLGNVDIYYGTLSVLPALTGIVFSIVQNVAPNQLNELKRLVLDIIDVEDDVNIKKFLDDITEYSASKTNQQEQGLTIASEPIERTEVDGNIEHMNAYVDRTRGIVELTPRIDTTKK